jgi:hypothetical protein
LEEVEMSVPKKVCLFVLLAVTTVVAQRQTQPPRPQVFPPTADQRAQIDAKLAELTKRIDALSARKTDPALVADVDIYRKAAAYIVRFPEEFFTAQYAPETIAVLDMGLARVKELEAGGASWTKKTGNVVRGYVSSVDGSVQPYGLTIAARRLAARHRDPAQRSTVHQSAVGRPRECECPRVAGLHSARAARQDEQLVPVLR